MLIVFFYIKVVMIISVETLPLETMVFWGTIVTKHIVLEKAEIIRVVAVCVQ